MLEKYEKEYKHKISYGNLVHLKNKKGQWASNCVLFNFSQNIKETCDDKKKCIVLDGCVCEGYIGCSK